MTFWYSRDFVPRYEDCYAIRISYGADSLPIPFWYELSQICEAVFITEHHDTERKHIHLAMYNSRYTHDRLRKKIVQIIKDTVEQNPPTGNALMSVKKWDGSDIYLVYMLKGTRYKVVYNATNEVVADRNFAFLTEDYIAELRAKWIENMSKAAGFYNDFKKSVFWVEPHESTIVIVDGEQLRKKSPIPFDTIRIRAIEFSMAYLKLTAVDAKVRYIAKDIVSNYCLFNGIKMQPLYI